MAGRFADGVWLAELAAVADPALVASVVAAALRVRELPGCRRPRRWRGRWRRQQLLLVLDNCEHVIGAAAGLCAGLLQAGDDVRILATSREPLRVAGEARYRLAPLTLPGRDDLADAAGCEAVALFTDRARQADMHFALDEETGPAVAQLVARLDGMPLAIELAAARVEVLGVAQLLERIDDRFALLAGGDRLAADRQRSLAATVEWSYRLLEERERRVFRAVSVFPAGVHAGGSRGGRGSWSGTGGAAAGGLLAAEPAGGWPGWPVPVRDAGDAALLRGGAAGRGRGAGLRRGRAGRVRAAGGRAGCGGAGHRHRGGGRCPPARCRRRHHAPSAGLGPGSRGGHWPAAGGRAGAVVVLARTGGRGRPAARAADCAAVGSDGWCAARFWLGWTALYSADLAGALGHFTAVSDAVGARGPSRALADCLAGRSVVLSNLARFGEAIHDGRQALVQARELGYPAGEALALAGLTIAAAYTKNFSSALRLARQGEQITADLPGWLARFRCRLLTGVLNETGDLAAAEDVCAAGLARSREVGDLLNLTRLLTETVGLALRAGRADDAAVHLRELLLIAARTGGGTELCNGLEYCGFLCAATRRHAEAVTVWAAYAALRQRQGSTGAIGMRRRQEATRQARQALGPARARAAEERGAAMSQATAVEYALLLTGPQPTAAPSPGQLSARERELVTLVAQGLTDAQIAGQLYISVRTVRSHLDRVRDKTGCRRRTDLTRLALAAGLV